MSYVVEGINRKVRIRGRTIRTLRFANGIGGLAEEEQEPEALLGSPDKSCSRYTMKISAAEPRLTGRPLGAPYRGYGYFLLRFAWGGGGERR